MPRPQYKRQGEWTELRFMSEAVRRGLSVSKTWGDSARYDVALERRGRFLRVQVKSTSAWRAGKYRCMYASSDWRRPYTPKEIDFLVLYVIPLDTWYIIPSRVISGDCVCVYPRTRHSRGRYERYRDAWNLLL